MGIFGSHEEKEDKFIVQLIEQSKKNTCYHCVSGAFAG